MPENGPKRAFKKVYVKSIYALLCSCAGAKIPVSLLTKTASQTVLHSGPSTKSARTPAKNLSLIINFSNLIPTFA